MLSRRAFLISASAAAVSAALPMPALPAAAAQSTAAAPQLLAFAVGTPGEYDWQAVLATSAEDAFKAWAWDRGICEEDEDPAFDPGYVQRVPIWDGLPEKEITPALWFAANMGHMCERCNYETHPNFGGEVVNGEVVCEDCIELGDLLVISRERALEALVNEIVDLGPEGAREHLVTEGVLSAVPADLWAEAIKEAAAA